MDYVYYFLTAETAVLLLFQYTLTHTSTTNCFKNARNMLGCGAYFKVPGGPRHSDGISRSIFLRH